MPSATFVVSSPSDEVATAVTKPFVAERSPEAEPTLSEPTSTLPANVEVAVVEVAVNVGAEAPARNCTVDVAVRVPTVALYIVASRAVNVSTIAVAILASVAVRVAMTPFIAERLLVVAFCASKLVEVA